MICFNSFEIKSGIYTYTLKNSIYFNIKEPYISQEDQRCESIKLILIALLSSVYTQLGSQNLIGLHWLFGINCRAHSDKQPNWKLFTPDLKFSSHILWLTNNCYISFKNCPKCRIFIIELCCVHGQARRAKYFLLY